MAHSYTFLIMTKLYVFNNDQLHAILSSTKYHECYKTVCLREMGHLTLPELDCRSIITASWKGDDTDKHYGLLFL